VGWCGRGGSGGRGCAFECARGGEAGAKKNRKPSSPARFRVRPVKRRCRVMEGGGWVVWATWWWWCACTFERAQGGRARAKKNPKTKPLWLGFGWIQAAGWGWGVLWCYRAPCCCNLMGGELGVSWYGGRGLLCSPWDLHPFLHLHLLPTLSLSSPSAPMLLLGTHKVIECGLMGLAFGADLVRTMRRQSRRPIAFGGV